MLKKRSQPTPAAAQGPQKRSTLLRSLLGRLKRQDPPLRPPGQRSGEGASSLEPFLQKERDTKPGPLE